MGCDVLGLSYGDAVLDWRRGSQHVRHLVVADVVRGQRLDRPHGLRPAAPDPEPVTTCQRLGHGHAGPAAHRGSASPPLMMSEDSQTWLALADSPMKAMAARVEVSGETVFFYTAQAQPLLLALQAWPQLRTLHRPANLEDLFLKLTGRQIRENA